MSKKSNHCKDQCCCHHGKLDLNELKTEARTLIKDAKNKYKQMKPADKQKLNKNLAIGGAVALGLLGLKKIFSTKRK